ncbi:MAG: anhydro-N-acetylmuramic acid kinase [Chloroflexi bacterium]|nr:MAG: anhydro-N-acetylmuramic acid kinase [Chloroflexota bacterium]
MIAIGMMSGTSVDGIDIAAVDVDGDDIKVISTGHRDYDEGLRKRILAAASGEAVGAAELAALHVAIGDAYAETVVAFVPTLGAFPAVIAMHGQTVAHLPRRATLQLGDASRVALRAGVPTIADFRSANVAAGGEGAPLVPFADFVLFGNRAPVALLNLGGIANLTLIPKADAESVIAFDTGPANILSDLIAQRDGKRFDEAGGGAARGRVDERALGWAFGNEYFAKRAPKSTGREDFGQPFADELARRVTHNGGTRDDALATAIALTARTVADGLRRETPGGTTWRELIIAGGGARNPTLVSALRAAVAPTPVRTSDELGIPVTSREAVAFAILGAYRMQGKPNILSKATGASRAVSGGAIHQP